MKKAFALIYVLMITTIVLISTTSILSLGLSDIRQKNKVLATAGAYQMAQSGIEDGIAKYKKDIANCSKSGFYNVKNDSYGATRVITSPIIDDQGDYWFNITCTGGVTVDAIGYFKDSKLKMKADIGADDSKWDIYQVGF